MAVLLNHSLLFIFLESTKGECKNQGTDREREKEERRG